MDLIETLNAVKFLIEAIGGGFIAFVSTNSLL